MSTGSIRTKYPEQLPFQNTILPEKWQIRLETLYSEPQRHYHTANHISALLNLFHNHSHRFQNPKAVHYAILFHDAIYDPTSTVKGENEERSIALFKEFVADAEADSLLRVSETDAKAVEVMIRATITHTIPDQTTNSDHPSSRPTSNSHRNFKSPCEAREESSNPMVPPQDIALFLDFDLSILAAPRSKYEDYMQSIRLEYDHYADSDYCAGRTAVLHGFLKREKLFFSTVAEKEGWDHRARENLEYEISVLNGGELTQTDSPGGSKDTNFRRRIDERSDGWKDAEHLAPNNDEGAQQTNLDC